MRGMRRTIALGSVLLGVLAAGATAETPPPQNLKQDVQLVVGADTLFGTLELPGSLKPVPLVIMLAGSGPTDRDGNSAILPGKNNCLKMLADSLLDRDIATLRYDKRGIAASARAMKGESELRLTTYSDDAAQWSKKYRHDARFKTLTLLGHSEGALIATLAAKTEKPDALILVSGAGRPARDIIHEQLKKSISGDLMRKSDAIMDTLAMGKDVVAVPPMLMALYRPSVQPYMRSWITVDPAAELKELKMPTMVVWGTSDIQVSREDADLLAASRKGIKKLIVPDMNHVLKPTLEDPMAQASSYSDSTIGIRRGVSDALASFVRGIKR